MAGHPFPEVLAICCGGDETVFNVTASMIAEDAPAELKKLGGTLGRSSRRFHHRNSTHAQRHVVHIR